MLIKALSIVLSASSSSSSSISDQFSILIIPGFGFVEFTWSEVHLIQCERPTIHQLQFPGQWPIIWIKLLFSCWLSLMVDGDCNLSRSIFSHEIWGCSAGNSRVELMYIWLVISNIHHIALSAELPSSSEGDPVNLILPCPNPSFPVIQANNFTFSLSHCPLHEHEIALRTWFGRVILKLDHRPPTRLYK